MSIRLSVFGKPSVRLTPLRIEGVKTTLTPQPDEAEHAAQALLDSLTKPEGKRKKSEAHHPSSIFHHPSSIFHHPSSIFHHPSSLTPHTPAYYRQLSEKIRASREAEARLALRFLAYAEQTSDISLLPSLEQDLYRWQDVAERRGGDLLRRWQHCLADIIVRQMYAQKK